MKRATLMLTALVLLLCEIGRARADFIALQLNSSNDNNAGFGYATTTGGNYRVGGNYGTSFSSTQISNVYLSTDNGVTFLNSGDGPTTSIDLPTSTVGTFTYQFYYTNAPANALTLQLWSSAPVLNDPSIVVSTLRDANPAAFAPTFDPSTVPPFVFPDLATLPPGAAQTTIGDYTITLTRFTFTNGSGPAGPFSVTPGASITPEISGEFTIQITAVPEPALQRIRLNRPDCVAHRGITLHLWACQTGYNGSA